MTVDLRTKLRLERFTPVNLGGGHVSGAVIGGGFLLGLLFGAVFLAGSSDAPEKTTPIADAASNPVPSVAPAAVAASPVDAHHTADDLSIERERLHRELEAEILRREVESLRRELVQLKTSPVSTEPAQPVTQSRPAPLFQPVTRGPSPGEATLTYWNHMNAVILQEAALRAAPAGGVNAGNATGFLDARIQAAQFAVNGIEQLDSNGVDARVAQLGEKLIGWYADARKVAESGRQLLTRASVRERQGSAGKMYQASEHRHAQDVNAINDFGEQVRQEMSRKYGISFPPLN